MGCGTYTIGPIAHINLIGIKRENFLFSQPLLNSKGEQYFIKFAGEFLTITEKEVACHLHGDGAAAAANTAGGHQFHGGAKQARHNNAAVFEETVIFGGKKCIDHSLWDFLEGNR